jgi:uncharacterized protein
MKARVELKVKAGAKVTGFAGRIGDAWKLNIAAPPVNGAANEAIIRHVAELARVSRSAVRIVRGAGNARKMIEVDGIGSEALARVILESHGPRPHTGSAPPGQA